MTANDTSEVLGTCERGRAEHQRSEKHQPRPDRRTPAVVHRRHRPRLRQGPRSRQWPLASSRIGGDDGRIEVRRGPDPWT
jgi:hypothetical protein